MIKIVQITTDSREHYKDYQAVRPYFGTAPEGLLSGFSGMPGVEVHVVCCVRKPVPSPEKIANNIFYHSLVVPTFGWGRTLFLGCAYSVRKLLDQIQPDMVHGQGTERDCALAAVLSGYPSVLTIHGNMRVHAARPENRHSSYHKIAATLEKFCLKHTDGVVAISRYTEDLVKDLAPRTWLLPNAVDRRYFDIQHEPPQTPRILFVGSIDERKNPIGLIDACEPMLRAGECTITFAGQEHTASEYTKTFRHRLDTVPGIESLGFLGRDDLAKEFSRSTLLVLPTFEDNCPMVVLEAMAAGLPVAASRVGGVPDLITHDADGLMFDPCQSADVRACLEKLVRDPATRQRLGAQARITARERFHPQVIAAEHVRIYQEVLGR